MAINESSNLCLELDDGFICVRWRRHLALYSLSGKDFYGKISKVSKPRDSGLLFSSCSDILQASQQRCWDVCKISERFDNYNIKYRGFETSRNLVGSRLTAEWIKAQYEFCHEISCVCLSEKIRYQDNPFLEAFKTQWKAGRRQAVCLIPKTNNTTGCR